MTNDWQTFLSSQGAALSANGNEIEHFGDATDELQAAASASVLVPLGHLGLIECGGTDAKAFLHNQLTNDINHLDAGRAQHAAWCTAKGRMLASFVVWRRGEIYRLALASELIAATQKRLQMFVLRSKVNLDDLSDTHVLLGLAGPQAAAALIAAGLKVPAALLDSVDCAEIQVVFLGEERYLVAVMASAAPALWQKLAKTLRPAGSAVWRWLDISAGLPLITGATREEFVPQMADFEKIGGVSFHKGCYPGQEIVARTQYLGKVKRHLFRVTSDIALNAGDDLYSPENPDQSIGKIVSATPAPTGGFIALAVIQSNFAASVRLGAIDGAPLDASAVNPQ